MDGILQDSSGRACVLFDPCLSHSVEAVHGIRLVLVAFTPKQGGGYDNPSGKSVEQSGV